MHDALLATVIAHPDDDAPRLVFADWCEEQGDTLRAELIRVQVALARVGPEPERKCRCDVEEDRACDNCLERTAWLNRAAPFRRREDDLLRHRSAAELGLPAFRCAVGWRDTSRGGELDLPFLYLRRGFGEHLTVSWEVFAEVADELLRCHPVTTVHLLDGPKIQYEHAPGQVYYRLAGFPARVRQGDGTWTLPDAAVPLLRAAWPSVREWELNWDQAGRTVERADSHL